ncbi:MAG: hypothetical protein ACI976_001628, partial [Aureispira sp.]
MSCSVETPTSDYQKNSEKNKKKAVRTYYSD